MAGEPRVAFIVPRRPDGGRRDILWEFCEKWWEERFPDSPIYRADSSGQMFNRGEALNRAAAFALHREDDVLVVLDGDVVAEREQVQAAVDRAHKTGRATFAFDRYLGLDEAMTNRILDGYDGDWTRCRALKVPGHCSSIMAVPRALWERAGGFDERLKSWGMDDLIFTHVCRALGGGIEWVPGDVHHLHHAYTAERAKGHPGIRANEALGARYFRAQTVAEVEREVELRDAEVTVVVVTHGRRDCIERTLDSVGRCVKGLKQGPLVIADDSNDIEYRAWLRRRWSTAEIVTGRPQARGFGHNTARALHAALETGTPWVFHLEDDFVIQRPVDLGAMAGVMDANPHLSQIVLRRQPWFKRELAAGGLVESDPGAYTDHRDEHGNEWIEHRLGHWTNPNLVRREFLAAHPWPTVPRSEAIMSRQVIGEGFSSAFWESRTAPPLVEHIGERTGRGY